MAAISSSPRLALLITGASGLLDAYTFLVRGGVFANAQTGTVLLLVLDERSPHIPDADAGCSAALGSHPLPDAGAADARVVPGDVDP